MSKTIVVYGSTTGTCQDLAERIGNKLGVDSSDVVAVSEISESQVEGYDNLVLGTSTWGFGDMQDDWYDGVKVLKNANLAGKKIAIFGCGDCESYSDSFCGGMGELHNELKDSGATFIGQVAADAYSFSDSQAVEDGQFVGLALDEVSESDKTDERIDAWVEAIKPEL